MPEGSHQSNGGARTASVILADALEELRDRERKLIAFEGELADVRRAIKQLEKAATAEKPKPKAHPQTELKQQIVEILKHEIDPMTVDELATRLGRDAGGWLHANLKRLEGAGAIAKIGDGYGIPAPAVEAME